MKRIVIASISALAFTGVAFADEKPSDDEAAKINDALAAWGCSGGTAEKESEGSGVFEVDDAKCKGGQYDVKLDSDFSIRSITRD